MAPLPSSTTELLRYQTISRAIPYLASLVAISGTSGAYLLGLPTFAIISLYATIPIIVASAASFTLTRTPEIETVVARPLSQTGFTLSVALYFLFHGASILLFAALPVRPFAYYVFVGLTAAVVVFQILQSELTRSTVTLVLLEISGLMLSVIWSVTMKYYYYFGRTDVFPHDFFVQSLLETNHVTAAFGEYQAFPLWHVLMAFQTMLFGGTVEPLTLFFAVTGVLYAIATIAAYALALRFDFSKRVSLVAALGMVLNPFVLLYGMYSIPRSVTSFLLIFCLLGLLLDDNRGSLLYLGLVAAIAVYHTVTLPFIFVTLGVYYAIERWFVSTGDGSMSADSPVISTMELLAIPVIQVIYWAIADPSLIRRLYSLVAQSTDYGVASPSGSVTSQFIEAPYQELLNYVPFSLILLFVLFAIVQSARNQRTSRRRRALLLTGLAVSALAFPSPVLLVSMVSNITPDNVFRFGQYTYPFIMIAFAVGVVAAVRSRTTVGSHRAKVALAVLLIGTTAFMAVSNDFVASDNPVAERDDFYNFYFTETEVNSFNTLSELSETDVESDYVTCRYINNPGEGGCGIIQANPVTDELLFPPDSPLVLRKDELRDRPLSVFPTDERVEEPPFSNNREGLTKESAAWDELPRKNKVYDSAEVSAYSATA